MKRFITYLAAALVALFAISCTKKLNNVGCPQGQMCTMLFATVGVDFVDAAGDKVAVSKVTVTNMRTNSTIVAKGINSPTSFGDHYVIVTDSNKKELSTQGDDVRVTATSTHGKTVTAVLKISGGCNCHVELVSGSPKIVFN